MDFEKTSISTKVRKFLQENLKDEKDKESLQNIITEKALLKNDAINLLITILQALTIPDSTDDEEISVVTPVIIEKDEEDSPNQKELFYTCDGWNMKSKAFSLQNKIRGEITECYFYQALSLNILFKFVSFLRIVYFT